MRNKNKSLKIIGTVVIVAIIVVAIVIKYKKENIADDQATSISVSNETLATGNEKYEDGEYSDTGMYTSPAGSETVEVTLIIQNDKVVSATFKGNSRNPTSARIQKAFNDGFDQFVIGKSIDEISLDVVNGSSLTPKGFMEALEKIKVKALRS